MKKRKLKSFVIPTLYGIVFITLILSMLVLNKIQSNESEDFYTYVNSSIISKSVPTILETTQDEVVKKPFISDKVEVYKKYYENSSSEEERKNSILFYNNTYVQNTGVFYKSSEKFDINSILDGTVIEVKTDDTLGNVVEIKHKNNIISIYQGLSEVLVKKDQIIKQGEKIGLSGKIKLDENLENSLLFELTKEGKLINPEIYFEKKVNEL